ncbi:MAG: hypothetical protein E7B29_01385, partial [Mixta calida]|nr:hypothetical protein [Mixta calida]
ERTEQGKGKGAKERAVREKETLRMRANSKGKNRDVDCKTDLKDGYPSTEGTKKGDRVTCRLFSLCAFC